MPKYNKRKNYRKRRKMVRYKQPSLNYMRFRLRTLGQLVTDGTGGILARIQIHSMSNFYSPETNANNSPLLEKDNLKALFDQYKVQGVTINYTPGYNNFSKAQGITSATEVKDLGSQPGFYIVEDVDNTGLPSDIATAVTRNNVKQYDLSRKFKCQVKARSIYQGGITSPNGWLNMNNEAAHTAGVVWMLTDGPYEINGVKAPALTRIGSLLLESYILVRARQ